MSNSREDNSTLDIEGIISSISIHRRSCGKLNISGGVAGVRDFRTQTSKICWGAGGHAYHAYIEFAMRHESDSCRSSYPGAGVWLTFICMLNCVLRSGLARSPLMIGNWRSLLSYTHQRGRRGGGTCNITDRTFLIYLTVIANQARFHHY